MRILTETRIRAAKPAEKPYKLFDERGLFMLVTRAGARLWRFRYFLGGVEKLLTLGEYPDVSLKRAREKRDDARRAVADGIDPGAKRRAERDAVANTFEAVADEWLLTKKVSLTESTWERDRQQIHKRVVPYLGSKPIALKLAPYVFVRPGELRAAEWSEMMLDGDEPVWRIPAERMKMREAHIVPLAQQSVDILKSLVPITGRQQYVFPSIGGSVRPVSENTLNGAIRRLGYSGDEMTSHGFRSMPSTLLNEQGVHHDLIELQLAHVERNTVRAAYNRAQRLAERRVMQNWANYLDTLRANPDVAQHPRKTISSRAYGASGNRFARGRLCGAWRRIR